MQGGATYSPLQHAHQRIGLEKEARAAAREVADTRAEVRERARPAQPGQQRTPAVNPAEPARPENATPPRVVIAAGPAPGESPHRLEYRHVAQSSVQAAQVATLPHSSDPARPLTVEGSPKAAAPEDGPAPGESRQHYAWRMLQTQRIAKDNEKAAAAAARRTNKLTADTEAEPTVEPDNG